MAEPLDIQHWDLRSYFSLEEATNLWLEVDPFQKRPNELNRRFYSLYETLKQARENGELKQEFIEQFDEESELDNSHWRVSKRDLANWALAKGQVPKFLEPEAARIASESVPSEIDIKQTPGEYTTPLLELQKRAIDKFWRNWDRKTMNPPTNEEVSSWLMKKYGLKEAPAQAIATIIRHPDTKKGGRPTDI